MSVAAASAEFRSDDLADPRYVAAVFDELRPYVGARFSPGEADAPDPDICGHSDRVARISVRLARQLDWPHERLGSIYMAGLLHDIGKIGIDERLLRKPEQLTGGEYERIRLHPELGYRILTGIDQLSAALPAVLYHHEQWDGRGYPEGLAGEKIPEIARIIAVADAHDAMTSDRPYRAGMPLDIVHRVFQDGAGSFWDPRVVEAYFRVQESGFTAGAGGSRRRNHPP